MLSCLHSRSQNPKTIFLVESKSIIKEAVEASAESEGFLDDEPLCAFLRLRTQCILRSVSNFLGHRLSGQAEGRGARDKRAGVGVRQDAIHLL